MSVKARLRRGCIWLLPGKAHTRQPYWDNAKPPVVVQEKVPLELEWTRSADVEFADDFDGLSRWDGPPARLPNEKAATAAARAGIPDDLPRPVGQIGHTDGHWVLADRSPAEILLSVLNH